LEIIQMLIEKNITNPNAFEWAQQLRFDHEDDAEHSFIKVYQTKTTFEYGCEYQGNNGRLVVTPLTDRCYMTLTSALYQFLGGAPQGPAGTGKTETVKDLAKNLAFFTVIENCSAQANIFSLGKLFTGLALSGSWGCFDEFNRISVDVLSVVAGMVKTLLDAIRKNE
jgi:dynein heavy chain